MTLCPQDGASGKDPNVRSGGRKALVVNTQSRATGDGLSPKPVSSHRVPTGHREPSPPLRGPSVAVGEAKEGKKPRFWKEPTLHFFL